MTRPAEARFWPKVDRSGANGCWLWTGTANKNGYGHLSIGRRGYVLARRFAYELAHGAIPAGKYVRNSCRNTRCVNPAHLYTGDRPVVRLSLSAEEGRARRAAAVMRGHMERVA